jgi:cytochrome c oxidase assembly protein subunit 15
MQRLPMALPRPSARAVQRFAGAVLVYNLAVVGWGAFVRASGSGAGCGSHWPLCNGELVPTAPALKTLIELTHRLTSGVDGALSLLLLAMALFAFPRGHRARLGAGLFVGAMVLEAGLGAGLVKLGLVDRDASPLRAVGMALHQVATFYLLASLALTVLWAGGLGRIRIRGQGALSGLQLTAVLCLPLLAATGAIAALGDTLFPSTSLAQGMASDFAPAAHLLLRLRILHPVLALLSLGLVGAAAAAAALLRPAPEVQAAATAVGAVYLLQLGTGLLNLALLAPTWLQLVHLLLADLTWLAVIRLVARTLAAPTPGTVPAPVGAVPGLP